MARKTPVPFSWKKHTARSLQKKEYRIRRLAVTNSDFQIAHPDIAKDVAKGSETLCCKYAKELCDKIAKNSFPPPAYLVNKRFNRS